jgi:hypothetical protein
MQTCSKHVRVEFVLCNILIESEFQIYIKQNWNHLLEFEASMERYSIYK